MVGWKERKCNMETEGQKDRWRTTQEGTERETEKERGRGEREEEKERKSSTRERERDRREKKGLK